MASPTASVITTKIVKTQKHGTQEAGRVKSKTLRSSTNQGSTENTETQETTWGKRVEGRWREKIESQNKTGNNSTKHSHHDKFKKKILQGVWLQHTSIALWRYKMGFK